MFSFLHKLSIGRGRGNDLTSKDMNGTEDILNKKNPNNIKDVTELRENVYGNFFLFSLLLI